VYYLYYLPAEAKFECLFLIVWLQHYCHAIERNFIVFFWGFISSMSFFPQIIVIGFDQGKERRYLVREQVINQICSKGSVSLGLSCSALLSKSILTVKRYFLRQRKIVKERLISLGAGNDFNCDFQVI